MIFLDIHNRSVEESLLVRFENAKQGGKFDRFDEILADFDGVLYRLHTLQNDKSKIIVSIFLTYSDTLLNDDIAVEFLRSKYGPHFCPTSEAEASVTLLYDLTVLPEDHITLAHQAALLRRNCFAAVLERFFRFHLCEGEEEGAVDSIDGFVQYRPRETLFIKAMSDRITVIFNTRFKDPEDVIIGKVFLQEFTEIRRRIDRAPQVFYSYGTCPAELRGTAADTGDDMAHITFVLFSRHLLPTTVTRSTNLIFSLRNYLHYHIKCSRGYIHRRMRAKTSEFIKILNRAHPQHNVFPVIMHTSGTPVRIPSLPSTMAVNGGTRTAEEEVVENGTYDSSIDLLVNGFS